MEIKEENTPENMKEFKTSTVLSNTLENVTQEELYAFNKLNDNINRNDRLYLEWENMIIKKMENNAKKR
ncbi:hypothetical protein KKG31_03635 [Patescibacteria group bacterium]|nr:hypothetical protein [Patescibacteria group bacterium]MBU1758238.1 hypothetical protein [Patescibacteria group bacterium]